MNTRKISLTTFRVLNLVLILVMTFGSAIGSVAAPSPTGATIASDQADYPPGGTVILTGLGWVPGEIVNLFVNDDAGQTWSLNDTTIAGADGSFIYQFQLPSWFVANYSVTATGPTSGTATTSFTDLSIGTYDQCSNDDGDGYATGDTGCRWINGNLQSNNSTYFEGDATVQRVWLTGFLPGTTHTLTLQYGTTKGGKHAYDFLTTWDWSEDWIQEADRCQGITGCDGLSEDKLDIPEDPNVPNSFEPSAPGDRQFVMRGGDMTSATTPVIESGSYAGDSETIITITFTVANSGPMCPATGPDAGTCGVALWFGAHVSAQANWGLGQGAGSISGSPYHVALYRVDGASVGQRDNQMQANTVTFIPNGTIVIVKDAVPNDAQDFSFNLNNGTTISQDFTLDDDGEVLQVPNSQTFSVPPGTWTASELNIPAGWTLTNLVCNDPSGNTTVDLGTATATINLASLETVTCTFTDNKAYNQDLTVSKTATAAFGRSYTWDIYKNVDKTQVNIAEGGEATFNYTVGVTHDNGTDSGYTVSGVITVSNPNNFDIAGVDISDAIDNGGTCSVTDGVDVTVPANVSVTRNYSCSFDSNPGSGTNTATATWDATTYFTTSGTASGIAGYDFSTATPAISNGTVTVTDTLGGNLGTVSYTDASPTEFTYSKTFSGVAGTCTNYDNTATITETGKSASQRVTVCVGKDLTVSKTVDASRTRTYKWLIDKSVDDTRIEIADGGKATFNYTVTVTPDGFTDSGYTLGGAITINNPNDWQDVTVAVADVLDQGGTCSITESGPFVVPMGDSLILHYTCTTDGTSTQNTATVSWDETTYFTPNGSAFDDAAVSFGIASEVNKTITVIDDKTDPLNPVTLGTSDYFTGPFSFTYSLSKQGVAGTCTEYTNIAVIYETNQSDSQTVTVCVGLDLTVSKTATGAFNRLYNWTIDKSVDDTLIEIADGGTATFNYTVDVTPNGFTDSGWTLSGTISVTNPNDWQDITADVIDAVDVGGGASCTVVGGEDRVITRGDTEILNYSCTFTAKPTYTGTNTATATWDAATYFTPTGTASGTAAVTLALSGETNRTITVIDDKTDPLNPVTLGTSDYYDGPFEYTYSLDKQGVAGTCTEYTNIAAIYETNQSDSQTVTVCVGSDLTVSKTATTAFTRTYTWTIDKSVDKTKIILEGANPQSATFNYTVAVSHDSGTDSGWSVSGVITVSNPNDWQDISANVSDLVDVGGGAVCNVESEASHSVTVPADGSVELDYSCSFISKPSYSGLNTATADWTSDLDAVTPSDSTSGTANVNFTTPTTIVDGSVTVVDDKTDPANPVTLGTASYTDASPKNFTYSLTKSGVSGACTDYTNTATFTTNTTATTDSDSQTVKVCSSNITVLKLTKGPGDPAPAVDPTQTWTFNIYTGPDGFGGSVLASDNTSGDADGLLDFDFYNLNPAKTYTLCELNVPSGWTAEWMIDTTGDGTPDTVVIPYNPNANDPVPQDLGNRCFDFGADTSYSIPEGGKLAFQVINEFPGGAPRTPGYWKNWNRCTGGGQAANADRQGGRAEGFTLLEDILTSPGIIWDDILTDNLFVPITSCEQAVEILDQREVKVNGIVGDGRKRASDAARTLAMHLLAAQLNEGNGACINQDVKDVILYAEKLLDRLNFDGTLTRDYLRSRDADYAYALQLAAYLDAYNNSNCNFSTLPAKPINKYP